MFLGILLLEVGALLIYAGVKGKSVTKLVTGDNTTPAKVPSGSISPTTVQPGG